MVGPFLLSRYVQVFLIALFLIFLLCYLVACKVNYHNNYYIKDGERVYYDNIPQIIQVGNHQFIEVKVVNVWITLMVVSWTSATNCARFYNSALIGTRRPPPGWVIGFGVTSEQVSSAFVILSLLEDHAKRSKVLIVPHSGRESDRYKSAMRERNQRMRLYSQPEIQHYCKKCTRFYHNGTCV